MTQLVIYTLTIMTSIMFLQMNHPLAMGLTLLIQTMLICLITGLMAKSFWFSYILFLIFLGGMLVLFIYVTSLASNEMFSISSKSILIMSITMMMMAITITIIDKPSLILMMNNEMESIYSTSMLNSENTMNLNKLYNFPTNNITIMLIMYLLMTLIATVKITNMFHGPLRPMN